MSSKEQFSYVFAAIFAAIVGGFILSFARRMADIIPLEWLGAGLAVFLVIAIWVIWNEGRQKIDP